MGSRWYKPLCVGLTALLLAFAAYETWYAFTVKGYADATGGDLRIYTDAAVRLFTGQPYYRPEQLAGPHPLTMGDVLYPPAAMWFVLPFVVIGYPGLLAVWGGTMLWCLRGSAPWTWPIVALILALPMSLLAINAGNPTLLVACGVALALRAPWAGPLILLKPTMAPFALIGIRRRQWAWGFVIIGVLSLPFLAETMAYPQVVLWTEDSPGLAYSLWHWPLALLPVAARLGVPRPRSEVESHPWRRRGSQYSPSSATGV